MWTLLQQGTSWLVVNLHKSQNCLKYSSLQECIVLHENIDQTFVISLHNLLNCEIGGLDCDVITI